MNLRKEDGFFRNCAKNLHESLWPQVFNSNAMTSFDRPVVPGCAGCAMAHPDFGRSVSPISTKGDRLCPPNYNWHSRIFRPSKGPVITGLIKK